MRLAAAPLRICHRTIGWMVCSVMLCGAGWTSAGAQERGTAFPPEAVLLLEIDQPTGWLDSDYLGRLWQTVSQTREMRERLGSAEAEPWRQAARFLEQSLETDWRTALRRLTAGGVKLAVSPTTAGAEPEVLLEVEADASETLQKFLQAVQAELAQRDAAATTTHEYRGQRYHRAGEAYYAPRERTLVATNSRLMLERYFDHLLSSALPSAVVRLPRKGASVDPEGGRPLTTVRGSVSLEWLREIPEVQRALAVPASEPAAQLLLGGYLDLLRRAGVGELELAVQPGGVDCRWRFDAGAQDRPVEWTGFFADGTSARAWPLLQPAGTVYSGSWYRDYQQLWQHRKKWLTPRAVSDLESENERQRRSGTSFGVIDLVAQLGAHYRVVVAQPAEERTGSLQWPRGAVAIELRDQGVFQQKFLDPLATMLRVAAAGVGAELESTRVDDFALTTCRFRPEATAGWPPGVGEALSPTLAIGVDQLLLGTSHRFVLDLLPAVKGRDLGSEGEGTFSRVNPSGETSSTGTGPGSGLARRPATEELRLSIPAVGRFLAQFRQEFERDIAREKQLTPDAARTEVDLLLTLFDNLGALAARVTLAEGEFEYRLRLGE